MDRKQGYTSRVLTPIRLAVVAIVLVSIVLIIASYEYGESDRDEWISSILLDVGFIMLGLAIAFVIGERLVNVADDHKWHEVDAAVCHRSFQAALTALGAFSAAPSIKTRLEQASPGGIPTNVALLKDYSIALKWGEETLLPTVRTFTGTQDGDRSVVATETLTRHDWAVIRSGTSTAYSLTTATVTLALPRDIPSLLSDLLDLETALNGLTAALSRGVEFANAAGEVDSVLDLAVAAADAALAVLRTVIDQED